MSSVEERVTRAVSTALSFPTGTLQPHTSFDSLGADSLDMIDVVIALEKEFGITIPDSAVSNARTIQDVVNFITGL